MKATTLAIVHRVLAIVARASGARKSVVGAPARVKSSGGVTIGCDYRVAGSPAVPPARDAAGLAHVLSSPTCTRAECQGHLLGVKSFLKGFMPKLHLLPLPELFKLQQT